MKFFRSIAGFVFLIVLFWGLGFAYYVSAAVVMRPEHQNEMASAIVVLTGGDQRVETGLELFAKSEGRIPYLFITGVNPQVSEADIRAMWKGQPPLRSCCIVLGHSAQTTAENARETRDWIRTTKLNSIRLVTANYHMKRALLEFSHAMPEVTIFANPVTQPGLENLNGHYVSLLLSEYNKYLVRLISFTLGSDTAS